MHTAFPSIIDEKHKLQLIGVLSHSVPCGAEKGANLIASVKDNIEWLKPFIGTESNTESS